MGGSDDWVDLFIFDFDVDPTMELGLVTLSAAGVYADNEFNEFLYDTSVDLQIVAPVPLPAAAWLLLSGLGGLGFVGRRRQAG